MHGQWAGAMRPALLFLEEEMKLESQGDSAELSESEVDPSGNGIGTRTIQESHTLAIERSGSSARSNTKATGPRTQQGKQRASRNATKHGVFSKVAILHSESKAEYEKLLAGLRETLRPEGTLEELLVEKLAVTAWRQRRLFLAEVAEIRKNTEFVESDQRKQEREAAGTVAMLSGAVPGHGLINHIENPDLLEHCLGLLARLRGQIEKNGFCPVHDKPILERIYGSRNERRLHEDLYEYYEVWRYHLERPESESDGKRWPSLAECGQIVMEKIDKEIRRIKRDQKARSFVQAARTQLEIVCRNVPDGPGLDRLLRYEASLDRSFDRTLSQLERLQRMRLGQPVLPKLEVSHSMS